jgi:hypothetical protein
MVLGEFATQLSDAFAADGRPDLADQVDRLALWSPCGCPDDFCASFYTGPEPEGAWRDQGEHECVLLCPDVPEGLVNVDTVDGAIRYVEVHGRPDVKRAIARYSGCA